MSDDMEQRVGEIVGEIGDDLEEYAWRIAEQQAEIERLKAVANRGGHLAVASAEIQRLKSQNTRLAGRIGCGCGGDYGLCNECAAALAGEEKR
jgi:uncharacterized small protein (DUF1192 family)